MRRLLVTILFALAAPLASAEPAKAPAKTAVVEKTASATSGAEKTKAKAETKSAAKGVSKTAAAKPRAEGPFDARDPESLIALLGSLDAKATVAQRSDSTVKLQVETPNYSFGAEFVDCSASGKGCKGLAFTASSPDQRATLAQLNSFNQTSITCRLFQDRAGKVHVLYSTLLSPTDTREEMRTHLGAWQGCLASFGAFLQDPSGYLATAP
jgi:hypothetical protein